MTGTNRGPAPSDALSDRATTGSPPMTADGPMRLSGRTPARGLPDQSSCRGREPRPTAIGKSGCHLATPPARQPRATKHQPQGAAGTQDHHRIRTRPTRCGEAMPHCPNHFNNDEIIPWTDARTQVSVSRIEGRRLNQLARWTKPAQADGVSGYFPRKYLTATLVARDTFT